MIDPRLNDHGYTETERSLLAARAGLIAADHPQLWKDSDLLTSAERADARRARDVAPQGETVRLFEPAPAQIPGQTIMLEPEVCGGTGAHDGQPINACDECSREVHAF